MVGLDGEETVAPPLAAHTTVTVPRGRAKHAFEWTHQKFYVIVAEDEDGSPCAVDKDLKIRCVRSARGRGGAAPPSRAISRNTGVCTA